MERWSGGGKTSGVRRIHRWGLVASAVCAVLVTTAVASDRVDAQSAGNGLDEASVNSFEFDPGRGVVRATIDIDLRNVTTDRVEGDTIRRSFFDNYAMSVPLGAENIVATREGIVLEGTLDLRSQVSGVLHVPLCVGPATVQRRLGRPCRSPTTISALHRAIRCRGGSTRRTPVSSHSASATRGWSRCGSRNPSATNSTSSPT